MKRKSFLISVSFAFVIIALAMGCEQALEQRDCVVMLGDSIFALSDEETAFLEDLSGQVYRNYYVSGAQMEGGLVATIPTQYNRAKRADSNIRTVIFDGGGNDVLIGGQAQCGTEYGSELSSACWSIIDEVSEVTADLIYEMINDGVKNIVMQGYYHSTDKDLWQVAEISNENTKEKIAALNEKYPDVNIIFVDVMPHFDKNQAASYTKADGIHPTTASSEKLADLLWAAMVENGIEQGEGCESNTPGTGCN